jgi:hypothetical protein
MSKFQIAADSMDELVLAVAKIVRQTQSVEIRERKKGEGFYGIWDSEPVSGKSIAPFKTGGIPLEVSLNVVYHRLTDPAQYAAAETRQKAATLNSIERLKARLAKLESKAS